MIYFISDTHFGHENAWSKFKRADGSPLRPFTSTEEMDETMVDNWNKTVKAGDTVYHCGDVVIAKKSLHIMSRLNGRKILIMGNHDIFGHQAYLHYFEDIRAYKVLPKLGLVACHIPVHPDNLQRFPINVHGHLHANLVMLGHIPDPRYVNVSVEQINYTPISLDEIIHRAG